MSKIKVLDLAREVGMEDDKLLLKLKRMGVKVKDKKSEEPEKMKSASEERIIERDAEKEIIEKRVKPTVIRRRTRNLEQKVEPAAQVEVPPPVEGPTPPPIEAAPEVLKQPAQARETGPEKEAGLKTEGKPRGKVPKKKLEAPEAAARAVEVEAPAKETPLGEARREEGPPRASGRGRKEGRGREGRPGTEGRGQTARSGSRKA